MVKTINPEKEKASGVDGTARRVLPAIIFMKQ